MATERSGPYRVFDDDGVAVTVTSADLDWAATTNAALSTALANAAGLADLVENLHRSLSEGGRASKLAAAKALMALGDRCVELLDDLAVAEPDEITAKVFTAVAVGMRGTDVALAVFRDPATDPKVARLLVSNYNSALLPTRDDVRFLTAALGHYADRDLPVTAKLKADLWENGVNLILTALEDVEVEAAIRAELRAVLNRLVTGDDDSRALADALLGRLI